MSDLSSKAVEVRAIADVLWFLPPPARAPIADKLHGLGVRVHHELATLQLEREGPKQMGNHAKQRPVKIDKDTGLQFLRSTGDPKLVDLADRIENAQTPEQIRAERERLAPDIPQNLAVLEERINSVRPEDLE